MRSIVFNSLDDLDQLFLGDPKTRPSMEMWKPMWLDGADRILTIAEQSFVKFRFEPMPSEPRRAPAQSPGDSPRSVSQW